MDTADRRVVGHVRYKKGYTAPEQARAAIKSAHRTSLLTSSLTAASDVLVIVAAALGCGVLGVNVAGWMVPVVLVAGAVVVARFSRGLENLVHEGSHFNWSRHYRRCNDALVLLAAIPVGASIGDYRSGHLKHHGKFGTPEDPDLTRYRELDLEAIDRSTALACFRSVVARFGRYQLGWLREASSGQYALVAPLVWACVLIVLPAAILGGVPAALLAGLTWSAGFFLVLPLFRLIAESSEHVYSDADTVFDATISNLGLFQRLVLHPHNDGYHTVHHMWPGVPHHRIARLHRFLVQNDPSGYGDMLRYRTRVRQTPARSTVGNTGRIRVREANPAD